MSTELLFRENAYLKTATARVLAVHERGIEAGRIERETNALIARGIETETVWVTDEELDARPDLVKTMSVQPPRGARRVRLLKIPGIDLQPCGGTHVKNTAEIGAIRVLKIRSEGKRNRRVEIALAV
jgi:misacylated tRNA(Ala) deacylase